MGGKEVTGEGDFTVITVINCYVNNWLCSKRQGSRVRVPGKVFRRWESRPRWDWMGKEAVSKQEESSKGFAGVSSKTPLGQVSHRSGRPLQLSVRVSGRRGGAPTCGAG